MSTKKSETSSSKPSVNVSAASFLARAKKISTITERWFGVSPNQIQEGLTSEQLGEVEIANLVNQEITILGYKERTGKIKGKETNYLVVMAVEQGQEAPCVFVTGAQVIMKKLQQAANENALPISGTIMAREGADFNYFDFV